MVETASETHSPPRPWPAHPVRPRVTLVIDDQPLAERLRCALTAHGVGVSVLSLAGIGGSVPQQVIDAGPVLVDLLNWPQRALATIEQLCSNGADRPVLALCGSTDAELARRALTAGALDFCQRDAPTWELQLRLLALLAPPPTVTDLDVLSVGDLELDPRTRTARRAGQRLVLSGRQFELLRVLMLHAGTPLNQARLLEEMGVPAHERSSNVIEVHIYHLRRLIGSERLSTVRGSGYVLHAAA